MNDKAYSIQPVLWHANQLKLLDQRVLPQKMNYLPINTMNEATDAIRDMVVRGAPAIGVCAAYAMVLGVRQYYHGEKNWYPDMHADMARLSAARPTAVNLQWAIEQMNDCLQDILQADKEKDPFVDMLARAKQIHEKDIADNQKMGQTGADIIQQSLISHATSNQQTAKTSSTAGQCAVITHCNAGALATGGYGTALGVIRSAWQQGVISHVYADETRPWLQGARLTAWELVQENIPVSLMVEGAASYMMQQAAHPIKWVIVGADRIAANGDVANKIGTCNLAVLARYFGLNMMVVAPTSTIDLHISEGAAIPVEQRAADEVLGCAGKQVGASGAQAVNPAFDITPAELVDVIVTEKGAVHQPDTEKMAALFDS